MVYRSLLYGDVPHRLFSPKPVIGILLRLSRLVGALLGVVFGAILWVGTCSAQEAPEAVAQPRQVATVSTSRFPKILSKKKKTRFVPSTMLTASAIAESATALTCTR